MEDSIILRSLLWTYVKLKPTGTIRYYCEELKNAGFLAISPEYVRKIFHTWKWSWKKAEHRQLQKFSHQNIRRYLAFLKWLHSVPKEKVKFLDEGHFVSR